MAGGDPVPSRKPSRRARPAADLESPMDLLKPASPTVRLEAMTRERIDSLEADKAASQGAISALQAENKALLDEVRSLWTKIGAIEATNARLSEALSNARSNGLWSTLLIAVGSGAISYAAFIDHVSKTVAAGGAGLLIAGVVVALATNWRSRPEQ